MRKTCPIFSECQPGTETTERACPGAKVRATVHRDWYKNRPDLTPDIQEEAKNVVGVPGSNTSLLCVEDHQPHNILFWQRFYRQFLEERNIVSRLRKY